jgi:hypothetical protein
VQHLPLPVGQVSLSHELPLTLDEVIEDNYTCICLGICPPSNVCCVSDGTDCKILKSPNYGNEMEEL